MIQWAEEYIPGLVRQGLDHEFSPFEILDEQERIEELLRTDPEFQGVVVSRKQPISIQIAFGFEKDLVEFVPKTGALDTWETEIKARINSITNGRLTLGQIAEKLSHLRRLLGDGSSSGLSTGLIQALPQSARQRAFQISNINALVDFLDNNLTDPLPGTFRPSHGLAHSPRKTAALSRLTQLRALELELWEWFGVLTYSGLSEESSPDSLSQLLNRKPGDLAAHINSQVGGNGRQVSPDEVTPWIDWLRSHAEKRVTRITEYRGQLELVEIPPSLSIFRGCAGNDCSTSSEFAIINDPNERVFLIFGNDKKLKGYLQGTLLDVEGRPSFYVITVNGPHLSEADTVASVEGIRRSLKEIGAEQLVIPLPDKTEGTMNFPATRSPFLKWAEGKEPAKLEYRNPDLRSKVEAFRSARNGSQHDFMSTNTHGIILDLPDDPSARLRIAVAHETPLFVSDGTIQSKDALRMALDFMLADRDDDMRRTLRSAGIPEKEFLRLRAVLQNLEGLSRTRYQSEIRSSVADLGRFSGIAEDQISTNRQLTLAGNLRARDCLSLRQRAMTFRLIEEELARELPQLGVIMDFVRMRKSTLAKDPVWMSSLNRWIEAGNPGAIDIAVQSLPLTRRGAPELTTSEVRLLLERTVSGSKHPLKCEAAQRALRGSKRTASIEKVEFLISLGGIPKLRSNPARIWAIYDSDARTDEAIRSMALGLLSDSEMEREASSRALGALDRRRAAPRILEILSEMTPASMPRVFRMNLAIASLGISSGSNVVVDSKSLRPWLPEIHEILGGTRYKDLRQKAFQTAVDLSDSTDERSEWIGKAIGDKSPSARAYGFSQLSRSALPPGFKLRVIGAGLRDSEPMVRNAAIESLDPATPSESALLYRAAEADINGNVRKTAISKLIVSNGRDDHRLRELLVRRALDKDSFVRQAAIEGLKYDGVLAPELKAPLEIEAMRVLGGKDSEAITGALQVIENEELRPAGLLEITRTIALGRGDAAENAGRIWKDLAPRDPGLKRWALQALESRDPEVRQTALWIFGGLPMLKREKKDIFIRAMSDRSPNVRMTAYQVGAQVFGSDSEIQPRLVDQIADSSDLVSGFSASVLEELESPRDLTVRRVLEYIDHPSARVRASAVEIIRNLSREHPKSKLPSIRLWREISTKEVYSPAFMRSLRAGLAKLGSSKKRSGTECLSKALKEQISAPFPIGAEPR